MLPLRGACCVPVASNGKPHQMSSFSYTRALLQHWGVRVEDISTSDLEEKKEADFLATFGSTRVLIEEKTKEDDPDYLAHRASELESGEVHGITLPIRRDETISGIVRSASKQLKSSSNLEHEFRLMWFTATGVTARGKYEQFMATLYDHTNILEMNASGYRRCYFFRNADFFRRASVIDGAVAAHTDGTSISTRLCLNPLSPRYEQLKASEVPTPFKEAVEDPIEMERSESAFILDAAINRKDEVELLAFLQKKYQTGPLMKFDLGYTNASILLPQDDA
jgi:hypothetical protein